MSKGRKWQRVVAGVLALFMGASSFHCAAVEDYGWWMELGNTGGFRANTAAVSDYSEIDGSGLLTAINSIAMLRYEEDGVSEALWGEKLQEIVERGWITWDNNKKEFSVHTLFPVWAVYETDVPMVYPYTSLHILTPNVMNGGLQVKLGLKWTKKLWRDLRYLPVYRKGEEAFSNNYGRDYLGYADIYEEEPGSGKDSLYIPVIVPETTQVYTAQPNNTYSVPLSMVEEGVEDCKVVWATTESNDNMRAVETADGDYQVTVDQGATAGEKVTIRAVVEDYEDVPTDIIVTAKDKKVDTSYTITCDTEQIAVPANEGAEPELAWYYGEAPATFTMQDPEGMLEGGTRTTYWKNEGTEETPNWVTCDQPTETTPVGTYKIKEERETADTYYWAEKEFTIKAAPVEIDVQDREKTYDEAAIAPAVEVTRNGTSIPAEYVERIYAGTKMDGTAYGPVDAAPTDAGTYTLTVRATGNYTGEEEFDLTIERDVITLTADPKNAAVGDSLPEGTVSISANGVGKFNPEPKAYYLEDDTGVIDLAGNVAKKVGTATIGIKDWKLSDSDSNNYDVEEIPGTLTVGVATVEFQAEDLTKTYNGEKIAPAVTVERNGTQISMEDVCPVYSYEGEEADGTKYGPLATPPTNAGTYKLTVTATGENYTGEATFDLTIKREVITLTTVETATVKVGDSLPELEVTVSPNGEGKFSTEPQVDYSEGDTDVIDGNVAKNVGTATIGAKWVLLDSKNYEVKVDTGTLTVEAAEVNITGEKQEKTYDGKEIVPVVTVERNGTSIPTENVHLEYSYKGTDGTNYGSTAPTNAGSYVVTVTATGNYIGEVTFELSIRRAVITITAVDQSAAVGDSLPNATVSISDNGAGKFSSEPRAYYLEDDTGVIDLTGNVASKVGTATIGIKDWVLSDSENYEVKVVPGTLTVTEAQEEEPDDDNTDGDNTGGNTGGGSTGGGSTGGNTGGGSTGGNTGGGSTGGNTGGGSTGGSSTGGGSTSGGSTGGSSTGGSSTGGSGAIRAEKTYPPKWEIEKGGDATIDIQAPKEGDRVTITPKPAPTRDVESVIVITDKGGKEILVTSNGDGTYSYIQPGDTVIIKVNFCERSSKECCPRDETCPIWPFPDAETREWYHNGVHYCLEEGLMVGYPDVTFQPGTHIDRGMLVTMLWRLAGEPVSTVEQAFTDVSAGAWYEKAVNWASEQGIVFGFGDGTFRPEAPLTREQNATIFLRYSQCRGMDVSVGEQVVLSDYTDADSVQDYAVYAMQWGVGAGLLDGLPDGRLIPHGTASRAEAATMMMRYCENIMK